MSSGDHRRQVLESPPPPIDLESPVAAHPGETAGGEEDEESNAPVSISPTTRSPKVSPSATPMPPVSPPDKGGISPFGWVLFFSGMVLLGSYTAMAKMSESASGQQPVPIPLAILLIELIKLLVSVYRLKLEGADVLAEVRSLSVWHVWPYAIPGLLYGTNNNLEIFVLDYMDPASYRLLNNFKIVTTAVLFRFIMRKVITRQQIVALALLLVGATLASQGTARGAGDSDSGEMFVTETGVFILIFYCFVSGLASVVNEWIMKKGHGSDKSVHLQNMILYSWGILFNAGGAFSLRGSSAPIGFESTTQITWWVLFIANGALHGLVISFMMKYLSSIYKLFMSASAIFVAGLVQVFILGATSLPMSFFVSAALVSVALYLYNTPGVLCTEAQTPHAKQ